MYRKYMHKYIFASIDWDINISIDFSLPNLKLSRLWRHGADLLRCTVTSPASWSKFQKWRTWESHASSIIFTVRNRLNRTESFQMTEKLIQWKKTSSETRAHSQISHSHSILGGQIFKQILSISFPRGPPEKTSGVSFLASIHEYVDGAILQCNGHLFAVRPLEGAQDLTHGRLSGRPLAVSVASNGQLWAGKTLWNPTKQDLFGHQICQKDMVSFLRFTFDCMCLSGHLSMSIHEMTRARQTCLKSTFPMPAWWSNFWSKVLLQKFAGGCECDWKSCNPWRTVGDGKFKNLCPKSLCSSEGRMTSWSDVPQTRLISYQIL